MPDSILSHSAEETRAFGSSLVASLRPGTLVTFEGELGAGKTTLIQGILEGLRAERPYVSPTFVLMKQYDLKAPSPTGIRRVYHADAYRVGEKDFKKLGFDEWCADPEGAVLLEWPERIASILPEKKISVTLRSLSETEREILVETK
ncbi:MAG: tRNA (adenosine(37)-N6)-threonylcarbamoyltransferase complex ATPase subunit type 1 TsaE [Candidatus Moraniibacteriota bacterium]